MVQVMHKNALACAVQQVHVCRQVKDYDFSDRCLFVPLPARLILFFILELTATCCVKLQLSLYLEIQIKNSFVFYCFLLTTLLFRQRLCSLLAAL